MKLRLRAHNQAVIIEGTDESITFEVSGNADELRVTVDCLALESLEAQLRRVDETLAAVGHDWRGTGRGRVEAIERLAREGEPQEEFGEHPGVLYLEDLQESMREIVRDFVAFLRRDEEAEGIAEGIVRAMNAGEVE